MQSQADLDLSELYDKRPYKKTYALSLGKVESFTTSLEYATKRGQNSIAKYRPSPALDLRGPAPVVPCATREPVRVIEPYAPPALSVILVMKRLSWDRIVAGKKTPEIKDKPLKPKRYPIGLPTLTR